MPRAASRSKASNKAPRRPVRRRAPKAARPKFMKFAGILTDGEAREMLRFVDEEFEKIED